MQDVCWHSMKSRLRTFFYFTSSSSDSGSSFFLRSLFSPCPWSYNPFDDSRLPSFSLSLERLVSLFFSFPSLLSRLSSISLHPSLFLKPSIENKHGSFALARGGEEKKKKEEEEEEADNYVLRERNWLGMSPSRVCNAFLIFRLESASTLISAVWHVNIPCSSNSSRA